MAENSMEERQKEEIREQINALQSLADRLPETKDEVIALLDELNKHIRVMQKGQDPVKGKDEPYIGS